MPVIRRDNFRQKGTCRQHLTTGIISGRSSWLRSAGEDMDRVAHLSLHAAPIARRPDAERVADVVWDVADGQGCHDSNASIDGMTVNSLQHMKRYIQRVVMAGPDPAIQCVFSTDENWITGSSPVMTKRGIENIRHFVRSNNSRPISIRRISLVPAPIS